MILGNIFQFISYQRHLWICDINILFHLCEENSLTDCFRSTSSFMFLIESKFYRWTLGIFNIGRKRALEESDIFEPLKEHASGKTFFISYEFIYIYIFLQNTQPILIILKYNFRHTPII